MPALAQGQPPLQQQMAPQSPQQTNNVCTRLEAQLQTFERSGPDQARTEQIKKYETAAQQQQAQLDRLNAQAKKAGCEGGGLFSIFSNQSAVVRPAEQPDFADEGQPGPHQRRPGAAAGQRPRPRARRPAPRADRRAGAERLRPAVSPGRGAAARSAAACSSRCSARARVVRQHHGAGRKHAGGLGLSHRLRAHVRRLLLPDLVFGRTEQVPRRREDLPSLVPRRRGAALHPPQSRRGHQPGRLTGRPALHRHPQCLPIPAVVRQRLHLQRPERRRRSRTARIRPCSAATSW